MVQAGFTDSGPDARDPANATWGASALLAGPDLQRLTQAEGNPYGFTDRLDYIFVANGVTVRDAGLVGERWPNGDNVWACSDPLQVENARAAAQALKVEPAEKTCFPTDHAGIVASLGIPPSAGSDREELDRATLLLVIIGTLVVSAAVALWAWRRSAIPHRPTM
jgi:hypothetical protein